MPISPSTELSVFLLLQGHVTFLRHAGASLPCPLTDITGGFNKFLAQAYGLTPTATAIQEKFGSAFGKDPKAPARQSSFVFKNLVALFQTPFEHNGTFL